MRHIPAASQSIRVDVSTHLLQVTLKLAVLSVQDNIVLLILQSGVLQFQCLLLCQQLAMGLLQPLVLGLHHMACCALVRTAIEN